MFQLDPDESLADDVRRVALEQLDGALESLRTGPERNEAVHDARKRCKKLRAVLRLVRDGLGDSAYREQNAAFRDASRLLSAARDRWVLVETVDALQQRYGRFLAGEALAPLRERLAEQHRLTMERVIGVELADQRAAEALQVARARVESWQLDESSMRAVAIAGVRRVYRRGREAFVLARKEGTTTAFHESRKQAKYLWYQARLLQKVAGEPAAIAVDRLESLSARLGEEHDLGVLRAELRATPQRTRGTEHLQLLLGLVDQRRGELRHLAAGIGRRVYARRPRKLAAQLERQWQPAGVEGAQLPGEEDPAELAEPAEPVATEVIEPEAPGREPGVVASFDRARRTGSRS